MIGTQILFNTEMVRAILAGTKTQTRRVIRHVPVPDSRVTIEDGEPYVCDEFGDWRPLVEFCPYQPGGIMWVRETWLRTDDGYIYRADRPDDTDTKWRPCVQMPHAAVRIFLRVTGVRVERLQDIQPRDIRAEGVEGETDRMLLGRFMRLWDSTITKSKASIYGWKANPWVFVIEFERIEPLTTRLQREAVLREL